MNTDKANREYVQLGHKLSGLKRTDIAKKFGINSNYLALFRRLTSHDFRLVRKLILSGISLENIAEKFDVPYAHMALFRKLDDNDLGLIRGLIEERESMITRRHELRRIYHSSVKGRI